MTIKAVALNELRLPVGIRTYFSLNASDVIHSFWIPSLGGKMNMIPGRQNRTSLQPSKTGVFRAPCAEFCGTSHALMSFSVIVMEKADYDAWRRRQAVGHTTSNDVDCSYFSNTGAQRVTTSGELRQTAKSVPT